MARRRARKSFMPVETKEQLKELIKKEAIYLKDTADLIYNLEDDFWFDLYCGRPLKKQSKE